ncbi:MAG: ferredoxin [bacterium]|nr:ferredoxin [bacterium]
MQKYKIVVDPDLCIGAASCVTIDPNTFIMNDENKAEVLDHGEAQGGPTYEREIEMTDDERETLIMAAESCPTLAIFVYDETGEQLYPDM